VETYIHNAGHARKFWDMEHEPVLHKGTDRMLLAYVDHKQATVKVPGMCEWNNIFKSDINGGLVCCTDGSKTNKGTGTGENKWGLRREHSCSPGLNTVFQAEMYAINLFKVCQELYVPPGITFKN
jgi:hypothetical protein